MKNNAVVRIIIFYIIAISISNLFRFELFGTGEVIRSFPIWTILFTSPLQSSGILIGSLLALYLLNQKRNTIYSMFGTSKKWSLTMGLVPVAVFSIFGVQNSSHLNPHIFGAVVGLTFVLYCLFEEFGWRGYLEDELSAWREWKRVLFIAFLWYAWHLGFLNDNDLLSNLKFFGILILGSWGIGKIIHSTKSIIAASCFHMIYNIWMMRSTDDIIIQYNEKVWIIILCIGLWILLLKLWEKDRSI